MNVGVGVQGTKEQGDGEDGGCEAAEDKEKGGGGGDEDVKSRITGVDSDPLDTIAVHKDRREEREGKSIQDGMESPVKVKVKVKPGDKPSWKGHV